MIYGVEFFTISEQIQTQLVTTVLMVILALPLKVMMLILSPVKGDWRYVLMECGGQSVIQGLVVLMPILLVSNSDMIIKV